MGLKVNDYDDVLIQWEIMPQEEKLLNKKLIPLLLLFLFSFCFQIPFIVPMWKSWQAGGAQRNIADIRIVAMALLGIPIGLLAWVLYLIWRRSKALVAEKYIITKSGINIFQHDGKQKNYFWKDFKGYVKVIGLKEGALNFHLFSKKTVFSYFSGPMVTLRGESENSDQIESIIKEFLKDITNKHYSEGRNITIIILLGGAVVGFFIAQYH